ncbi:NAD-dependent epimerase/dehydratase family protein [Spirulina subsalsa FACHB-351]|uniref:NAD-dependent epimerase/dehydratase family protein n=1 Tax=Spirulina subsalsa FACHB-351 TaxID=234711 RepID=A0ABT3L7L1_9CYAN|nr:NAD-dependent epimerase/dehydratase family protein [Spirulina subsalsa]MCW6036940.1 NAD-dependent epimerase/dehydratase family protein [Spirulina subsalsa FACHB-351]
MTLSKNCLITGGSGYFGSLLLQKLLQKGHNCAVFDLVDADDRPQNVRFYPGDIRDFPRVLDCCQGMDIIYHNVAQVPLAKDKKLFKSVNIQGTENTLQAALQSGVQKVVYTSSSAIFGVPKINPVTESTLPHPQEAYGKAKWEGEKLCNLYMEKGLNIAIIRPRTILGHGRLGIFQILFEWIYQGYNIPVLGKGDNYYQFIHADDLANACILAADQLPSGVYNCGTNRFGTMREVLEQLCYYAKTGSKVKSLPMTPTIWAMNLTSVLGISPLGGYHSLMYGRSMYFDTTKVERELQWKPQYSNLEMFIESYEWYLKNRDLILNHTAGSHHRSAVKQGILRLLKWIL